MDKTDKSSQILDTEVNKVKKYIIKVVILGDVNVGKSNIVRRLIGSDFQEVEATVGVEFGYIDIKDIDPENPNIQLSIQLWDTSGAERYRAITTRNADGAYLVYDVTSESSFNALEYWYDSIKKAAGDDIIIYLVGNKYDLINRRGSSLRQITRERAFEFTKKYGLQGWSECSAKENLNIKETFVSFYKTIYKRNKDKLQEKTSKMLKLLEGKRQDPKQKCC